MVVRQKYNIAKSITRQKNKTTHYLIVLKKMYNITKKAEKQKKIAKQQKTEKYNLKFGYPHCIGVLVPYMPLPCYLSIGDKKKENQDIAD